MSQPFPELSQRLTIREAVERGNVSTRTVNAGSLRTGFLPIACRPIRGRVICAFAPGMSKLFWHVAMSERRIVMLLRAVSEALEYVTQVSPTDYCDTSSQMSRFVVVFHPLSSRDMHGDGP